MMFTPSSNPIDKLSCWIYNKKEDLSRVIWLMGKHKKVKCKICGKVLDSWTDTYSPMQCGWHRLGNIWFCHRCLEHRNFKPYIEQIDADEDRLWKEMEQK